MSTHPPSLQVRAGCDVGQDLRLALEGTDPLLLSELPGDPGWTPEALEVAAVAAAFVAAFRAASRDARGVWSRIEVHASGLMEPVGEGQRLAGIGLDVMLDPYTGATAGTKRVIALQDLDIAVRRVASFAAVKDYLTT